MDKSFLQIKTVFINELAFTPRKIAVSVTFVFFCLLWGFAFKGLIELNEFLKKEKRVASATFLGRTAGIAAIKTAACQFGRPLLDAVRELHFAEFEY